LVIPQLRAAALSDLGRVRTENQDRCLCDESLGLFGVADGVGGLPGGAEAAETAARAIAGQLRELPPKAEPDLAALVADAHRRVVEAGRRLSPLYGIATTLTFGCQRGGRLAIAHVGDSRCYQWDGKKLRCLTEDHSAENRARQWGEILPPQDRLSLVQCVGQPPNPVPDLITRPLVRGDRFLFCTDGISRLLSDAEIAGVVGDRGGPADLLRRLVALALRRGGPDNASGVLVFVDEA
jgi:serine/threonine protein phosphatase PrpC